MKLVSNMEELLVQVTSGQGSRHVGIHHIRFVTLNVETISCRANEIVEMLTPWKVDLCCLQDIRRRGGSTRLIKGNNTIYKFFWCGDQSGFGRVGIMLAEKWVIYVISEKTHDHCCLKLLFLVAATILNVICCYAP